MLTFLGCWFICIALYSGLGSLNNHLGNITKAIKNLNTQISTESEDCEQPSEKDLNDSCLCGTVPS